MSVREIRILCVLALLSLLIAALAIGWLTGRPGDSGWGMVIFFLAMWAGKVALFLVVWLAVGRLARYLVENWGSLCLGRPVRHRNRWYIATAVMVGALIELLVPTCGLWLYDLAVWLVAAAVVLAGLTWLYRLAGRWELRRRDESGNSDSGS